ncbi:hypothetical protein JOB18_024801 [Solea senegalensis]|uniref:Uncharacterized protein n=1 Tax=Solea senegalensis TaxID=28829 RepID=A0AAV6Q8W5_SOLSE|nr:hypothetical protein JOB18_024801 [Solea senegalensis]
MRGQIECERGQECDNYQRTTEEVHQHLEKEVPFCPDFPSNTSWSLMKQHHREESSAGEVHSLSELLVCTELQLLVSCPHLFHQHSDSCAVSDIGAVDSGQYRHSFPPYTDSKNNLSELELFVLQSEIQKQWTKTSEQDEDDTTSQDMTSQDEDDMTSQDEDDMTSQSS